MNIPRIETAFTILKGIKREIGGWTQEGLDDIKDNEVYDIINLLRLFLEIKKGGNS